MHLWCTALDLSSSRAESPTQPGAAWPAGVVECVGIAIMVGLAVDYIVHMATCVAHCPAHGRDGVTFALRTMAMSVMSGAVTTIGAALFLLPCEMAAFQQFGAPLEVGPPARGAARRCTRSGMSCRPTGSQQGLLGVDCIGVVGNSEEYAHALSQCTLVATACVLMPCVTQQPHAGTMVVVTLSTALVFSLVVFPALCYVVDLKDPDTGSLAALARGDWRRFLGWSSESAGFAVLQQGPDAAGVYGLESGAPAELVREEDEGSSRSSDACSRHKPAALSEIECAHDES